MVEFTNDGESKLKADILARSPILRMFIDPYGQADPDIWLTTLTKTFTEKRETIISVFGEDLIKKDIPALLNEANQKSLFGKEISDENRNALIFCFTWMGYEISKKEDLDFFEFEILDQVFQVNVMKETEDTVNFIEDALICGVLWKKDIRDKNKSQEKDLDVYKGLIDKLDIDRRLDE